MPANARRLRRSRRRRVLDGRPAGLAGRQPRRPRRRTPSCGRQVASTPGSQFEEVTSEVPSPTSPNPTLPTPSTTTSSPGRWPAARRGSADVDSYTRHSGASEDELAGAAKVRAIGAREEVVDDARRLVCGGGAESRTRRGLGVHAPRGGEREHRVEHGLRRGVGDGALSVPEKRPSAWRAGAGSPCRALSCRRACNSPLVSRAGARQLARARGAARAAGSRSICSGGSSRLLERILQRDLSSSTDRRSGGGAGGALGRRRRSARTPATRSARRDARLQTCSTTCRGSATACRSAARCARATPYRGFCASAAARGMAWCG